MDEIMDQLNQVIEERVLELKRKSEEDKVKCYTNVVTGVANKI